MPSGELTGRCKRGIILAGSVSFSDRLITFDSLRVIWRRRQFIIKIGTDQKYFSFF